MKAQIGLRQFEKILVRAYARWLVESGWWDLIKEGKCITDAFPCSLYVLYEHFLPGEIRRMDFEVVVELTRRVSKLPSSEVEYAYHPMATTIEGRHTIAVKWRRLQKMGLLPREPVEW